VCPPATLSLSLKRRSRHTHSSALPHLLQVRLPSQPLPPHPHPHHHLRSTTVPWAPPAHLADCHAELKRVEEWRRRMAATMAAMRMRTGATVCGVTSGAYDCVAATASEGRSRTVGRMVGTRCTNRPKERATVLRRRDQTLSCRAPMHSGGDSLPLDTPHWILRTGDLPVP
jgi:hypothetical protein